MPTHSILEKAINAIRRARGKKKRADLDYGAPGRRGTTTASKRALNCAMCYEDDDIHGAGATG